MRTFVVDVFVLLVIIVVAVIGFLEIKFDNLNYVCADTVRQ